MFKKRDNVAYLYILPWIIGFFAFQLYPFVASFVYSFSDFSILKPYEFIGLKNYIDIFTRDSTFVKSFGVTIKYVLFSVPLKLSFALFIAMILNMRIKGIGIFRTIYYLPSILGGSVGIAVLWKFLFNKEGLVNLCLSYLKIAPINWLGSPKIALYTISFLSVWQFGSSMVLFLAALKQVPQDLYEAARIDGAGKAKCFFYVTVPLITPIIFFNLIMQMTNAFQEFSAPYLITHGGPLKSTYLYGMMLYENGFQFQKMGYASAQSWILFLVILCFTGLVFKSSPYWTFYDDGGEF